MVEIKSDSLSTALLGNQGIEENGKQRSEVASGVGALSGGQGREQRDGVTWTLVERAKVIKAMLGEDINSRQGSVLEIDQIDLILTEILNLERLRPLLQRLSQDEDHHNVGRHF